MAKIGSSSAGASRQGEFGGLADPFDGIERSLNRESHAPGTSWFSSVRDVAKYLALEWFGTYRTSTVREYLESEATDDSLSRVAVDYLEKSLFPHWLDEVTLPEVLAGAASLGEFVPLSKSPLGAKIIEFLAGRKVLGWDVPAFPLGGLVVDVGDSLAMTWQSPWETEFGSRSFSRLEIYRDTEGTEWAYVHTNLAVATRKTSGLGEAMARYVVLPRQVLAQLYIAETAFPSSIMTMGRQLAYPDVPEEFWPHPFASLEGFTLATYTEGEVVSSGKLRHQTNSMPQSLRAGFAISARAEEHFETIIPTVFDSVANLATIAEDGFRNYRSVESEGPYDWVYGSEYVYFEGKSFYPGMVAAEAVSTAGYSRFVPEIFLGALVTHTDQLFTKSAETTDMQSKREMLEWIVAEGAGASVSSAINSLVWLFLMPDEHWELAELLLTVAIDLDHLDEATNALTNLGQVQNLRGDSAEAVATLTKALERPDKYAESEASYHLGTILQSQGDLTQAQEYFERGAQGTGPFPEYAEKCKAQLGNATPGGANFCQECGEAVAPGAKFCGNCGSKVSG